MTSSIINQFKTINVSKTALAVGLLHTFAVHADAVNSFSYQWPLENTAQKICRKNSAGEEKCSTGVRGKDIKARTAWSVQQDCRATKVAVLDTGVDHRHPLLAKNLIQGFNAVSGSGLPMDDNLHGTHVTGTIAAMGQGQKVTGICLAAQVISVKVGDAMGRLTDSDILEGFEFAAKSGAKVVNASFGGPRPNAHMEAFLKSHPEMILVAAAGNSSENNDETPSYPAAYELPNVISVASTTSKDGLSTFSNYGIKSVHIAAPGSSILSTMPMEKTYMMSRYGMQAEVEYLDGTSMAAPHVTGAVALAWSRFPKYSASQIKSKLLSSSDKLAVLKGKVQTSGRLNLANFVR